MKSFALIVVFSLFFFLLGVFATVDKYQRDFDAIIKHCAPYNCTTDAECEEEERKHKFMQFNIV